MYIYLTSGGGHQGTFHGSDIGNFIKQAWTLIEQYLNIDFQIFGVSVSVLSVVIWSALVLALAYIFSS